MKKSNSLVLLQGLLIISAAACLMLPAGCSKTTYPSAWQPTPIVADGNLSDRTLPLPYYDDETKLNYSITNDAQSIYICARTSDAHAQVKMLKGGFTLWLDIKGGKNELTGIRYPLPQSLLPEQDQYMASNSEHGGGNGVKDMYKRVQKLIASQKQMDLIGFKFTGNGGNPNGRTFLHTTDGIAVAISADTTGELVYEATIPFKTFFKDAITSADTVKPISIGMVQNGLAMSGNGEHKGGEEGGEGGSSHGGGMGMSGGMGGGSHGGGMGMHGGGGHGGGGGGGSSLRNTLAESKTVWNTVRLSLKQNQ